MQPDNENKSFSEVIVVVFVAFFLWLVEYTFSLKYSTEFEVLHGNLSTERERERDRERERERERVCFCYPVFCRHINQEYCVAFCKERIISLCSKT